MIRSNMIVAAALIVGASCSHAQTNAVPRIVMEDIQSMSGRLEFQALMLIEEEFLPQSARIIDLDASSLIARLGDGRVISWQLRAGSDADFTVQVDLKRDVANGVNKDALRLMSGKLTLEGDYKVIAADSAYTASMQPVLAACVCNANDGSRLIEIFQENGSMRHQVVAKLPGSVEILDVGVSPHPDHAAPVAIVLKDQASGNRFLALAQWYLQSYNDGL